MFGDDDSRHCPTATISSPWRALTKGCHVSTSFRRRCLSCRFVFTSLFIFLVYYLMVNVVFHTRSVTSVTSTFLFDRMHGHENASSSFTRNLWLINNSDAERIYLYANLLSKHYWKANREYVDTLRREFNADSNVRTDRDLILTQNNVKLEQKLKCYVESKALWQQPNFVVTEQFRSTLPKESPIKAERRYEKCAIIGNSGSLRGSSCGRQIDGMDFIFRCNGAAIADFIHDVGKRTDFVSFNPSILRKQFGGLATDSMIESYIAFVNRYNSIVWYPCFGSSTLLKLCLKGVSYQDRIKPQLVIGHPTHYASIWDFWKRRGLGKAPSTGLYLVSAAVTMCNEIHLYGFWPFPIELRGTRIQETAYHYFNNIPFTSHHNFDSEFRILLQMHMLGAINLHTGVCM